MNVWPSSTRLSLTLIYVLTTCAGAVSCDRPEPWSDGHLTRVAVAAKQQGRSSATIDYFHEPNFLDSNLDEALKRYSFVTAIASAKQQVEVTPDEIRTWFVFDRVDHVAGVETTSSQCESTRPPTTVSLNSGQLAMPLLIGSADVQGVRLTMKGPDSQAGFRPGEEYLLFGQLCPDRVLRPAYGAFSVFHVDPERRIRPVATSQPNQISAAVAELGTVEALKAAGEGKNDH